MATATTILRNSYRDSVSLMQLSATLSGLPGVRQAAAIMATRSNLDLLREVGVLVGETSAGPNDLLITLQGDSDDSLHAALLQAEKVLSPRPSSPAAQGGRREMQPRSIEMGLARMPGANLALISTPGEYAAAEALKALHLGLHVMLFSDNVSLEDEIMLKRYAREHDLIVMGPDCGTAIIDGIPLGFANVVRRGNIGLVAASGTGLQQVTCLVDRFGGGISQAFGTGGRDLSSDVGGISMKHALSALAADPQTAVITLISKPPARDVASQVLDIASQAGKPVVVNFLGADPEEVRGANLFPAATLEDAALAAVALANGRHPGPIPSERAVPDGLPTLRPGQRYIRGLYSGGTFCYEASLLLGACLSGVYSNTPVGAARPLDDVWHSRGHTLIDLGDDVFTRGRPHPMIDHRLRNERLIEEARDPEVAVILLDVVLGYGAHPDPAGEVVPAIQRAADVAGQEGRQLAFVTFVCGTQADPQNLVKQEAALREVGAAVADSNVHAVWLATRIAARHG